MWVASEAAAHELLFLLDEAFLEFRTLVHEPRHRILELLDLNAVFKEHSVHLLGLGQDLLIELRVVLVAARLDLLLLLDIHFCQHLKDLNDLVLGKTELLFVDLIIIDLIGKLALECEVQLLVVIGLCYALVCLQEFFL